MRKLELIRFNRSRIQDISNLIDFCLDLISIKLSRYRVNTSLIGTESWQLSMELKTTLIRFSVSYDFIE